MDNYFDKSLHYLGRNNKDVFVMNIGAMDGVMFDEMIGYTNMYKFNGLYVEPIPYLFERLKNNIKAGIFENSAISDYEGEIEMMTIKRDVIDEGLVHSCFYGMSAVYPPKNGLGSEYDRPTVEKYGELVKVNCITYESLLKKHNIDKIDVIKIDAEGHDYTIFKQIDLKQNGLKVIRMEWINLSEDEQNLIIDKFKEEHFKYEISGQDIVGVSPEFYKILLENYFDINSILFFKNQKIDSSIISDNQIKNLVYYLYDSIKNNIDGDVVEFGCYVGESTKYLAKTLLDTNSNKKLYVYDSFEGLPPLSSWEENTGWIPGSLNTTEEVLKSNFEQNNLPCPVIHKDWFKNIPENKIPEKISFAFLDGDFYDSIYDSLSKIYDKVVDGGYICFHDYERPDLPGVRAAIEDFLREKNVNYNVEKVCDQLGVYRKNAPIEILYKPSGVTVVTGIWDIQRANLTTGWNRSFQHYLNNFEKLLKSPDNMIIFIEKKYESFVLERRKKENTLIVIRELDWFKANIEIFNKIQKIRTTPSWYDQVGWLSDSTQAKLEMYNPLVMSKMFLLNDASILDPFNSSHLVWVDGGLTNTVHEGYFWKDKVISNMENYMDKFTFVCFPYDGIQEIHGFKYDEICRYAGDKVNKVARGGFFGGPKDLIGKINSIYYDLLSDSLNKGLMGTEESIFTIMTYKYPQYIQYYEIEKNGLLGIFFENLKNNNLVAKQEKNNLFKQNSHNKRNVGLYVLSYNSPEQFETLCISFEKYDRNFLDKPKKYLLNNSLDRGTDLAYSELCDKYGFEEIKKDNLGICGGRQFIAEHANENNFDYHMFFEDDMFFYLGEDQFCRNGFRRKIDDFYNTMLDIIWQENFDFLKWNFSEFFGDNTKQWSWHNVPASTRAQIFPENPVKTDNNHNAAPFLKFKNIKSHKSVPYATGEIYYCNWPQIVSKDGNKKMFIDTKWDHPYEQTWMSYIYQETLKGNINPGILLATPTEHNRFDHYTSSERREN